MRGEILSFDDTSGTGVISGNDGQRYAFSRSAFQLPTAPSAGQRVDFEAKNGEAVDVLVVGPSAAATGDDRYASQNYGSGANAGYASVPPGVQSGLDWKETLLNPGGRTRRSHFWIVWICIQVGGFVLSFIPLLGILIGLALIYPNIVIQIRRLHDMDRTGWLVVVPWVANIVGLIAIVSTIGLAAFTNNGDLNSDDPAQMMAVMGPAFGILGILFLIGLGFLLWIGITDSKPGPNRFGPNPKDPLGGTADTFA